MNIIAAIVKLIYIHIAFVAFGIDHEYFYITRANCFADLHLFNYAIGNYKLALEYSDDPKVMAALGWCYSQINQLKTSLNHYRKAHRENPRDHDISLGLAYVEFYNNNIDKSKKIIKSILRCEPLSDNYIKEIKNLQRMIRQEL